MSIFSQRFQITNNISAQFYNPCMEANPPCSMAARVPKNFKIGDIIEGNVVRNEKQSEPPNWLYTLDGYRIPYGGRQEFAKPLDAGKMGAKGEQKLDPWTGTYDWDNLFSIRNFWKIVVFVFFVYLFFKYVLPTIKSGFKAQS